MAARARAHQESMLQGYRSVGKHAYRLYGHSSGPAPSLLCSGKPRAVSHPLQRDADIVVPKQNVLGAKIQLGCQTRVYTRPNPRQRERSMDGGLEQASLDGPILSRVREPARARRGLRAGPPPSCWLAMRATKPHHARVCPLSGAGS